MNKQIIAIYKNIIINDAYEYSNILNTVQKWLREVHNIEVEVYREVDFADECYYNTYCVDVFNNKLSFQSKDSIFTERIDTYEQALETGLLEGLKLINV